MPYRKVATVAAILALIALSFMPFRDKKKLHTKGRLHPWGHRVAFAVLAGVCVPLAQTRRARLGILVCVFAFAAGIEIAEHLRYRDPLETRDILNDSIGALVGGALSIAGTSSVKEAQT